MLVPEVVVISNGVVLLVVSDGVVLLVGDSVLLEELIRSTVLVVSSIRTKHVPPLGPTKPLLQKHSISSALPAGESELAGQLTHVLEDPAPEVV